MPRTPIATWLRQLLAEWGIEFSRAPHGALADRRLEVHLSKGGKKIHVATVRQEGREFVFEYTSDFKAQDDLPPISAFPDTSRPDYRSSELWPFFHVRLPPLQREDVQRIVRERGIPTHDPLRLIGELAGTSPTSPYILEYREQPRSSERPRRLKPATEYGG